MSLNFKVPCDPDHVFAVRRCLDDATRQGNKEFIQIFTELNEEITSKCSHVIRAIQEEALARALNGSQKPAQSTAPEGFIAMCEEATKNLKPIERTFPPNIITEANKIRYPLKCTPVCPFSKSCPYGFQGHYGEPCEFRDEEFQNEKWKKLAPKNPNEEILRR